MKRGAEAEASTERRFAFRLGVATGRAASALGASCAAVIRSLRGIRFRRKRGPQPAGYEPARLVPAVEAAIRQRTPGLARMLVSPDPVVRIAALRSLVDAPSPESGRILAAALVDPDASVRRTAAEVVGETKAGESVFSLILALEDSSTEVRQAAEKAVAAVTGRDLAGSASPEQRRERISELKQWWKEQRYGQLTRGKGGEGT